MMTSCSSTNNCTPPMYDEKNENSNNRFGKRAGLYRSSKCYRPLQQLYKTVYSPMCGTRSSRVDFACVCRPSERYKTTNMTYGSFHYNNWPFIQKNRPTNYDRELFIRCYENTKSLQGTNGSKKCNGAFKLAHDPKEKENWKQTTCKSCCPTDCCNDSTMKRSNCC